MNPTSAAQCLHCEQAPQEGSLRLCRRCAAVKGVRVLYQKTRRWTPAWDEHLQRLVERARARLPLFSEETPRENCHAIDEARSA